MMLKEPNIDPGLSQERRTSESLPSRFASPPAAALELVPAAKRGVDPNNIVGIGNGACGR
jgi:hypothetical protein